MKLLLVHLGKKSKDDQELSWATAKTSSFSVFKHNSLLVVVNPGTNLGVSYSLSLLNLESSPLLLSIVPLAASATLDTKGCG